MEPAPQGGWSEDLVVDPVQLFRFSALTFNAHRIHYDRAYATAEEGYPGLVVHGPLTALLLAESCRRRVGGLETFAFRATAPHFAGAPLRLIGEPIQDGPGARLRAIRCDGAVAMEATAG
jgi:3-methylfumaryl-CoA hydratase